MHALLMVMPRCGHEQMRMRNGQRNESVSDMENTNGRRAKSLDEVFFFGISHASQQRLANANTTNTVEWDSVASVTLFALMEEGFGTELDVSALGELTTFDSILDHLQTRKVS